MAGPGATPPPSTAPPPACPWPSSSGTRSAGPACTGAACRPRSSSRRPPSTGRSRAPASSGSPPGRAHGRLRRQPGPQARGGRPALPRACPACSRAASVTVLSGTGTLLPGRRVRVVDGAGRRDRGRRAPRRPGRRLGAPDAPGPRGRRPLRRSPPTSSSTSTALPPSVGGRRRRGAIGCEFASLLSDLGSRVTVLEALDSILAGCDQRRRRGGRPVVPQAGHRGDLTGVAGAGATRAAGRRHGHRGAPGRRPRGRRWPWSWSSVGRRPRTEGLLAEGTGVRLDERGFVMANQYQQTHEHERVGGGRPGGRHAPAGPRRLRRGDRGRSRAILGEPMMPVDYEPGAVGHLLPPRGGLRRPTEAQADGARASTSW